MYTDKNTNIEQIYVYASERSELENFLAFLYSKTAIFFQYFVGTSDTFVVQNDMLVAYM